MCACHGAIIASSTPRTLFLSPHLVQKLLQEEMLLSVPIVVLGNKIDKPEAASEGELRAALGLVSTTGKEVLLCVCCKTAQCLHCCVHTMTRTLYADQGWRRGPWPPRRGVHVQCHQEDGLRRRFVRSFVLGRCACCRPPTLTSLCLLLWCTRLPMAGKVH